MDCPFCAKVAGANRLPADELVWQFEHSLALLGSWQHYHGYCVLVSRQHATELGQLADAERRGYFEEMCLLARAVEESFRPHKLNYELLGNQAAHLHWHIFPRYRGDADLLRPVWLALDRAEHDDKERNRLQAGPLGRAATADALRQRLRKLA